MKSTSISEREGISSLAWPRAIYVPFRDNVTATNVVVLAGALLAIAMLLILHDPWNIRIALYLTLLIWTILRPRTALYLMAFAVPWGSVDYIDVKGLRMDSADLLVAFLAAGWLMSFALRRTQVLLKDGSTGFVGPLDREASNVPGYLTLAMVALITVMLLSMTVAISISSSLKEISKWLEFLVLVLLGAQYVRTRRQVWTIIILVCLAAITQAFFGYVQATFNLGPASFLKDASLRIYGTFEQPNPYAGYINLPLSITLALTLLGSTWKTRILAGLTSILLVAAEILTQSRGGELALAAALVFILALGAPRLSITVKLLALAGLGAVAAFLAGLVPTYVLNPILMKLGVFDLSLAKPTNQTFSTAERLAHWIAGLHMFFDHPILGVGIGNYPDAYPHYIVTIFTDPLGHAHNYYINIAAETGSIGLIVYLLFLLATFVAGAHAYRFITQQLRQARRGGSGVVLWSGPLWSPLKQEPRTTPLQKPAGTRNRLCSLMHSLGVVEYGKHLDAHTMLAMLTNDRALSIGLLAALISVCMHNVFDDLYVHSVTNLIALLLIALIRLERVMPNVGGKEDTH